MSKDDVLTLMRSSKTDDDWNANCDKVKAAHGGKYPEWWFAEVVVSGLMDATMGSGASGIKVSKH